MLPAHVIDGIRKRERDGAEPRRLELEIETPARFPTPMGGSEDGDTGERGYAVIDLSL